MEFFPKCVAVLTLLCLVTAQPSPWGGQRFNNQRPVQPSDSQAKQTFEEPLRWKFPALPIEEPRIAPEFELREPPRANSVSVECGESVVRVEANRDLFGTGHLIRPSDLTLGDCQATSEDPSTRVSEGELVYLFTLRYTPSPLSGLPILRTKASDISVSCHYLRKNGVSSDAVKPTWVPYTNAKVAEENLQFVLKLMTDDWMFERPSHQYFLGDVMKFEASVKQFHHVPLRVYVDSCVATLTPNTNTVPRYSFLGDHGCLIDGKLTGSNAQFMTRTQEDKLYFQMEAFRFQQDNNGLIYITCVLRATTVSVPINAENKACSFSKGSSGERLVDAIRHVTAVTVIVEPVHGQIF
ncbi:zona pellucida sperm-binding protein 3-like [Aplochiton taeniatus]